MSHSFTSDSQDPVREAEEFLYILTHDLKAFARAMRTIPDWIGEDLAAQRIVLSTDAADNLDMLRDYARRLDDTLTALTGLSRVGRLADPPAMHALEGLVTEVCNDLPAHPALSHDIDCGGLSVTGPRNDLKRLFEAVLGNVAVHHDRDFGKLRVTATPWQDRVQVVVTDDGPGIEPALWTAVFKPLATLHPKSETGRSGVGLAIAQKVVRSLHGEIAIIPTEAPRGLSLLFDLPRADGGH
ncbi:Phytochrome-like protein cph1 [Roseovarius sp. THAF9]|uniref:sensor histidine kinase n=1 Tax=Roseovarius sp. THAF9 TaxID=2587847 RepID=UPI0012A8A8B7|nr:HAMP domain-containing sensor histidine kinase [Roseovarius sp. THAF9]QFT94390.1 Phytochrome-like protein cph1 [Roseovarius sp. THAF9]